MLNAIRKRVFERLRPPPRLALSDWIEAEVFDLTDPDTVLLLQSARRRGVAVRLLLDPGQDVNRPSFALLRRSSTEVRWFRPLPGGKLHAKAVLADGLLLLGSANRDERVWARPDDFDIDRKSEVQHVGFGHGIHVCLGAALARLEMRVSLEEILRVMPGYEIDESSCTRVHSGNVRGWAKVPIRVGAVSA